MRGVRRLIEGDVTVVGTNLDAHGGLERLLSADESARAARFRRRIHRDRYVAARGLLRLLLGERLDEDPATLPIVAGPYGKPGLDGRDAGDFNVAHSGADALFAFTDTGDVGIDIERIRPLDPLLLSRSCFSDAERAQLLGLPASSRLAAFFEGWVRKEAVIKADGRGVSMGLDSFTVALCGPPRLLEAPPDDDARRWRLTSLEVGPALRAAVAVRSGTPRASDVVGDLVVVEPSPGDRGGLRARAVDARTPVVVE